MQRVLLSPKFLMLIGFAWLTAEFVLIGKYSFIYTGDNATALVPGVWNLKFTDAAIPLWNSFSTGGWDQIAVAPVGGINYLLFSVLPGWLAYQINICGQLGLALYGAYWLANRSLNQNPVPSLISAFVFASTLTGQLHLASIAFLPALLVTITRALHHRGRPKHWFLMAGMAILLSHTAWISELLPFTSAAVVTWFLFVDRRRKLSEWIVILIPAAALILLRAPDILALSQNSPLSNRSDLGEVPQLSQIPTTFNSIGNITALLLITYAIVVGEVRFRAVVGLLGAIFLWTTLPYAIALFHQELVAAFPIMDGYSYFSRMSDIPRLLIAVCAGFGMQSLWRAHKRRSGSVWVSRLLLATAMCGLLYKTLDQKKVAGIAWISQGNMVLNYESPEIQELAKRLPNEKVWPVRVEPFQMYPAYLHTYGIESVGGLNGLFSRRYHEFWGKIIEPSRDNSGGGPGNGAFRWTESSDGREPRFRGSLLILTSVSHAPERRLDKMFRLPLLSLANVGYFISRDKLLDPSLLEVSAPEKAWSSLTQRQKVMHMLRDNFQGRRNLYIYKNQDVLPRFFAVKKVRQFEDQDALLKALASATVEDLGNTLFVEARDWKTIGTDAELFSSANISVVNYASDRIELSVKAPGQVMLFVGNSYSPFWVAKADGREVRTIPANHAFWGMHLPAGTKSVVFEYRPPYSAIVPDGFRFNRKP